jgi:hypothetical protein
MHVNLMNRAEIAGTKRLDFYFSDSIFLPNSDRRRQKTRVKKMIG